jgi:iron(III) transport system ATP-binding protein
MRNAEIAQAGTPEELYTQPNSVFVATFMGEANHIRGRIEAVEGGLACVALDSLRLDLPARGLVPGEVDVVVRPEAVRIMPDGHAGVLRATVSRATYMGSHTEYHFETSAGALFALCPDRLSRRRPGETVRLSLEPEGVVLVRP